MKIMLTIWKLIPTLFEIIKSIEESLSESGLGGEKLALVRQLLEDIYGPVDDIWPTLEKVVKTIVSFFNAVGTFKKEGE